jgi:hypothetical protein
VGVVKEIYVPKLLQTQNEFETKLLVVVTAYVAGVGWSLTMVVCGELRGCSGEEKRLFLYVYIGIHK